MLLLSMLQNEKLLYVDPPMDCAKWVKITQWWSSLSKMKWHWNNFVKIQPSVNFLDGFISCVTFIKKRLWPSMISNIITMVLFVKANLCCHTNSLLMKLVDVPKSISAWMFVVVNFLHLIMIGNMLQGVGSKNKLGQSWTHD